MRGALEGIAGRDTWAEGLPGWGNGEGGWTGLGSPAWPYDNHETKNTRKPRRRIFRERFTLHPRRPTADHYMRWKEKVRLPLD